MGKKKRGGKGVPTPGEGVQRIHGRVSHTPKKRPQLVVECDEAKKRKPSL